jgi:hypothetical protein
MKIAVRRAGRTCGRSTRPRVLLADGRGGTGSGNAGRSCCWAAAGARQLVADSPHGIRKRQTVAGRGRRRGRPRKEDGRKAAAVGDSLDHGARLTELHQVGRLIRKTAETSAGKVRQQRFRQVPPGTQNQPGAGTQNQPPLGT